MEAIQLFFEASVNRTRKNEHSHVRDETLANDLANEQTIKTSNAGTILCLMTMRIEVKKQLLQ